METKFIDKLFLELSQITQAKTGKEIALSAALGNCADDYRYLRTIVADKAGLHAWLSMREAAVEAARQS